MEETDIPLLQNDTLEPLKNEPDGTSNFGHLANNRDFKSTPPQAFGAVNTAIDHITTGRAEQLTMTWYNICLRSKKMNNLHHINGFVEPGQFLCLLGDSKSGATELLKVLARQIKDVTSFSKKNTAYLMGECLIDGISFSSSNFRSKVKYVPKTDRHLAHLTTEETLMFAAKMQAPKDVTEDLIQQEVQEIMEFLGIDICSDVYVGDATLKGISGGQKRRVSIGVEIVGGYSIMLGDLITNGLDSVTAHEIVKTCQKMSQAGKSIILTVAQPAARTFDLFTNVVMLHEGHQIYFGPVADVKDYLFSKGMTMPEGKTLPQWCEEICSDPNLHFSLGDTAPDVVSYLVSEYRKSSYFRDMAHKLLALKERDGIVSPTSGFDIKNTGFKRIDAKAYLYTGALVESNLRRGWKSQLYMIWDRQNKVTFRNKEILYSRAYQSLAVSFLLAMAFMNSDDPRSQISQFFFIVEFLAFSAVPFIPQVFTFREVYYHQYAARYFNPASYFFGIIAAELPLTMVETMAFSIPAYFITGLKTDGKAFFYFYQICVATRFLSWSLCNFMVFMFPTATVAQEISTLVLPIFIVFGGLYAPKDQIPSYLVWMWDISFAKFGFRGLAQNQLYQDTYGSSDEQVQIKYQMDLYSLSDANHMAGDAILLWVWALFWNLVTYLALSYVIWDADGESALKYWWKTFRGRSYQKRVQKHKSGYTEMMDKDKVEFTAGSKVTLVWKNLSYLVANDEITILKEIDGYVEPGQTLALMGPSGAGKTTLMNVLAAKTTGTVRGEILVNGSERDETYLQQIGYVEQFDSHLWVLTVREAVRFSADLRLPVDEYSSQQKDALVQDVLTKVKLDDIADHVIGHGAHGLSQEVRKITSIAVELVSRPGLLFLDEPTTGLDSNAALNVTNVVQTLAAKGLAVVCTIHQPSPEVFLSFDKLLLLKARPGEIMYFENVKILPEWYEAHGYGPFPGGNIADFAIAAQKNVSEPQTIWRNSDSYKAVLQRQAELEEQFRDQNPDDAEEVQEYAVGKWTQFTYIYTRSWAMWSREHIEVITRFIQSFVMGLVLGLTYLGIKASNENEDYFQIIDDLEPNDIFQISLMFVCIEFATETGAQEIPHMVLERALLYRELEAKQYHAWIYYLARFAAQLPILLAQSILFSLLVYPLSQYNTFSWGNFFLFFFIFFFSLCAATTIAQVHAICTPSEGVGNTLYTTFMTLSRAYCGYVNIPSSMTFFGKFCNALDFMKYLFYALANKLCGGNSGSNGPDKSNYGFNVFEDDQLYKPNDEMFYIIYFFVIYFLVHALGVYVITTKQWTEK